MQIAPGNKAAIAALAQRIETSLDEDLCRIAAVHLGELDPGNKVAIANLSQILETSEDKWMRWKVAKRLVQTDDYRQQAINTLFGLVNLQDEFKCIQTLDEDKYFPCHIVENLYQILQDSVLKDFLSEQGCKQNPVCYEAVLSILWHCAHNMTYPDFCKAWHSSKFLN